MRIISKWVDYYDFVANQYGGGDPKIVYNRGRIAPLNRSYRYPIQAGLEVEVKTLPCKVSNQYYDLKGQAIDIQYLAIAGKLHFISRPVSDNLSCALQPFKLMDPSQIRSHSGWFTRTMDRTIETNVDNPVLIELSRTIGAPVFIITGINRIDWHRNPTYRLNIAGNCPILKDLGLASIISPFQMYQDIAYFVGNTMKPVPDTEPPVEVDNKTKILNAGFDLKQSFRHRT